MGVVTRRFDVYLVSLDPTVGRENQKTRPCVVVSPDVMNRTIGTVIIAPMTTRGPAYPTRVACRFADMDGHVALDQLRSSDKTHLIRKLGRLSDDEQREVLRVLAEMFAE